MRILHAAAACAVVIASSVSGCATVEKALSSPLTATAFQATVDIAIGVIVPELASKLGVSESEAASELTTIAQSLEAVDTGSLSTIQELQSALTAKVAAANFNPNDKMAADLLVTTLGGILDQGLQAATASAVGPFAPTAQVALKTVFTDVIQADSVYQLNVKAKLARKAALAHHV